MNSPHIPSAVGITGLLGTITLGDLNLAVGIAVGLMTLVYLAIKIFKELFNSDEWMDIHPVAYSLGICNPRNRASSYALHPRKSKR